MPSVSEAVKANALLPVARSGDLIMFLTLLGSVAAALAIGQYFGDLAFAFTCSAVLLTLGSVALFAARGRSPARLAVTAVSRSITTGSDLTASIREQARQAKSDMDSSSFANSPSSGFRVSIAHVGVVA
ncbi:hypothetical protein [Caballeronia sp. DA-9]|uniref:hypothetical protein n=1 Tax=Caballeronia sp. DA-9 TaxID=3436237 RepID=UPI003F670CA1